MKDFSLTMSDGKVIVGTERTRSAVMPGAVDTTAKAEAYRRRNSGKTNTFYRFSLPYATSLEGAGRWNEPTKLTTLPSSPFDGRKTGPIAHQTSGPYPYADIGWRSNDGEGKTSFDWYAWGAYETEDCCWLTIDTPRPVNGAKLPVRVYLHGGGNTQNPRMLPRVLGDALPIVTVTVEYPLSTFGFFTHRDMGEDHQINLAYACVLVALEWVQDHIADFGGDPNCVMLDGTSAGAAMASLLMPQHSGLFHRVLAHSGAGAGGHASREYAQNLADDFWAKMVKSGRAYYDRSRTIAEIAASDGIPSALRLGPSPQTILSFANLRQVYTFEGGSYTKGTAPDLNVWPARDGVIVQYRTAIDQAINAWPTSVPYMAGYVANEASLVNDGRDIPTATTDVWFARLGISSEEDKTAAIAMLTRPDDRWQRLLYGMLFGYGAERLCREHSLNGGSSYFYHYCYDSAGNGKSLPGHVNQHVYFIGKPEWQSAQGQSEQSLKIYEADLRLSYFLAKSMVNFAANGDPNDPYVTDLTPDFYDDDDLTMFDEWSAHGGTTRNCNVICNNYSEVHGSMMETQTDHEREFFDFVDARFSPS